MRSKLHLKHVFFGGGVLLFFFLIAFPLPDPSAFHFSSLNGFLARRSENHRKLARLGDGPKNDCGVCLTVGVWQDSSDCLFHHFQAGGQRGTTSHVPLSCCVGGVGVCTLLFSIKAVVSQACWQISQ